MSMNTSRIDRPGVRAAIAVLALASTAFLIGVFLDNELGATISLLVTPLFPVALILVGASRRSGIGPIGLPLVLVTILLEGGLIVLWFLRGRVMDVPWIGGLPLAAVVQILALWVLPFVVVVVAFARTFESFTLTEKDLERLDQISKD